MHPCYLHEVTSNTYLSVCFSRKTETYIGIVIVYSEGVSVLEKHTINIQYIIMTFIITILMIIV